MKISATLLLHTMESKGGWKEILLTLGQSYEMKNGIAVSQAVLSQVLGELTFTMKSRYKNLQKMAKSANSSMHNVAITRLENLLALILICGIFTVDKPVSSMYLHHLQIARERNRIVKEIENERSVCTFTCDKNTHHTCLASATLCAQCGHCISVHPELVSIGEAAETGLVAHWSTLSAATSSGNVSMNSVATSASMSSNYGGGTSKGLNSIFDSITIDTIDDGYESDGTVPVKPVEENGMDQSKDNYANLDHNWLDLIIQWCYIEKEKCYS